MLQNSKTKKDKKLSIKSLNLKIYCRTKTATATPRPLSTVHTAEGRAPSSSCNCHDSLSGWRLDNMTRLVTRMASDFGSCDDSPRCLHYCARTFSTGVAATGAQPLCATQVPTPNTGAARSERATWALLIAQARQRKQIWLWHVATPMTGT